MLFKGQLYTVNPQIDTTALTSFPSARSQSLSIHWTSPFEGTFSVSKLRLIISLPSQVYFSSSVSFFCQRHNPSKLSEWEPSESLLIFSPLSLLYSLAHQVLLILPSRLCFKYVPPLHSHCYWLSQIFILSYLHQCTSLSTALYLKSFLYPCIPHLIH